MRASAWFALILLGCTPTTPDQPSPGAAPTLIDHPQDVGVDALVRDQTKGRVRVRARVVAGSVTQRVDEDRTIYRFDLAGSTQNLPAQFVGLLPEAFRDGDEVVVEGRLAREGPLRLNVDEFRTR